MGAASDLTPHILNRTEVSGGRIELVEWHWPSMFEWEQVENELMLEMSLPPLSADASACFPEIGGDKYAYMGTLFIRMPGVLIRGRSAGGHIRVIRWVFDQTASARILAEREDPTLELFQSLLNIRNDNLRTIMRLSQKELANPVDRSERALQALFDLSTIEVKRLLDHRPDRLTSGRLAAWQYRRIRERLTQGGERPSVGELAELCGISPRHLHRQFLALTGETISNYVENFLIKEAKEMLVERKAPIKTVAQACGFSHPNSFSRAFRRATGLSPQQFRQRAQALEKGI
ncbi:MAG: helix-turn-helix transcriptional regulator [Sphingomonadaceae bacterium]|nr:helix-turn-helix transcriptional regulator [Sphingomonadaceae bacterium]